MQFLPLLHRRKLLLARKSKIIYTTHDRYRKSYPCAAYKYTKEGEAVVELDQIKSILATYTEPLVEVRDSL